MPAYHSTFIVDERYTKVINNIPLLALASDNSVISGDSYDITDEVLDLFKANTFFKNFEIINSSDRLLTYGILYINSCLSLLSFTTSKNDAIKKLYNFAIDSNVVPGEPNFKLNNMFMINSSTTSRGDFEELKQYLQAFRIVLANKLVQRVYTDFKDATKEAEVPSKFWMQFSKKKFMNKSL
ncbi:hypothetical protein QEN19_002643 [Hanseniaspora menglaensis]